MVKTILILVVILVLGLGAVYFAYTKGYEAGLEKGIAVSQVEAGVAVSNPMEKMPSTNPFEEVVNPFKDLYSNPFK